MKANRKKDCNLTKLISVRFRHDKFDRLVKIAKRYNISRPELIRKVLLDFIDEQE